MFKNKPLTSIIFTSYDQTQVMRNITKTSLESICKYTDDEDYELIWVDTVPQGAEGLWFNKAYLDNVFKFGEREDRILIRQYLSEMKDPGQYACYNIGAKKAKGDYFCFFQNDVFVGEDWLTHLKYHLDKKLADAIVPDQSPRDRAFVKESYATKYGEDNQGNRDAGLLLMTREIYDKVGGWDEAMRIHYGEKIMYFKLGSAGTFILTRKTMILHLEHAGGWEKHSLDKAKYDQDCEVSGEHLRIYEGR
jgi:hypothetical protein